MKVKKGQLVKLEFESREFEAIVIDPDGLGRNQPSIGFGFRMMERHGGLPQGTTSNWVTKESTLEGDCTNRFKSLKLPSGKSFRVIVITGEDNNEYSVIEVSEWVAIAADVIKQTGKNQVKKSTKDGLVDFLSWFAIKGFYADAYTILKGAYTEADSRAVSAWMQARLAGKYLNKINCIFLT
jgi:hypothetical protein